MKLTILTAFLCLLQLSASVKISGQNLSIKVTDLSIKDVIKEIEHQTSYRFFYNDGFTDLDKKITLNITNKPFKKTLEELFLGLKVSYKFLDNNLVVIAPISELQQQKISGKITDATSGEPLTGVTVVIEGTTIGTTADKDGKYSLTLPNANATLLFSFIGYNTERIETAGQSVLDVSLIPDIMALNEVVVIGYGTVKKRDLTGSIVSIKSEDITRTPTGNAMDALQGKVVGMDIMKSSGKAGSGVNITVRGNRSLNGNNSPLFIIDGFEGDYATLNPSDIESIDVLKDASSTAIYGSAGANGVVIITTKQAKEGKIAVNFDAYLGYNGFAKYPHGMTGDEYTNLKREAYRGQHSNYPEFMNSIISNQDQYAAYQDNQWIDYVDLLFRTGIEQNYNLSVSKGTEKTKSYFSLNYNNEQGLLRNDENKKYVVKSNTEHEINSWLKTGVNLLLTHTDNDQRASNVFSNSIITVPLGKAHNDDGSIKFTPVDGVTNPLSDEISNQYVNNTMSNYFTGNGLVILSPLKGLTFKSIVGVTLSSSRVGKYFGKESVANVETGFSLPCAIINNDRKYNYKWDNIVNYNYNLGEDHSFAFTGVTSWAKNQDETSYAGGSGFDLDSYSFYNLAGATTKITIKSGYEETQTMSFIGRLNYTFKGKYLFTVSNRWDGVSWLSKGNKWDYFPAVAVAWRMSDENFLKNIREISNLKLRLSYGVTGNSGGIGAYTTQAGITNSPSSVGFGETAAASSVFNSGFVNNDLKWEKSYSTNIGIDAGILNNRISLTLDVYNTDTKDILYLRSLPVTLGGSWGGSFNMMQNIGETNNKGIEIMINTLNYTNKEFTWNTTFTFSANKEKITSLPGGTNISGSSPRIIGKPLNSFYDFKYEGIWQTSEAVEAAKYKCVPGDIKLKTDGTFNDAGMHTYNASTDKFFLGSIAPDWVAGIQNSFTYQGFDASIFIMARWGQTIKDEIITRYNPVLNTTNSPSGADYWTPENTGAYLPRPGIHSATTNYIGFSSLAFVDGSYAKVKNITIGYTLPKQLLSRAKIEKLRFYATAHNPFLYAKSSLLKDQDPEAQGSENFPMTKQFVFGMNLTF